ncbi:hypothetical protein Tco_1048761 [Tanacetum coccineum]
MDSRGSYHMTYKRDYLFDFEEYDGGNVLHMMPSEWYVLKLRRNLISLGTLEKEGFTVKMQSGKIKVIKGSLAGLVEVKRNVLDFYNRRSTQQCTKSGVVKHLGVAVIHQQNGLVKETNVTLLAKAEIWATKGLLDKAKGNVLGVTVIGKNYRRLQGLPQLEADN